jgi:branched-chain amino acid transport system permease protein
LSRILEGAILATKADPYRQGSIDFMSLALQILITGAATGGVYGLMAVGHTLIYRLTGIIHFGFGDLVALGVFATALFAVGTGPVAQTSAVEPRFLFALFGGLTVCVLAGAGSYLMVIQPYLSRGQTVGWVAGTIAVAAAIRAVLGGLFQNPTLAFPDPIPFSQLPNAGVIVTHGATLPIRSIFVALLAVVIAAIGHAVFTRTRFGFGLQAVCDDVESAVMLGIPVERYITIAFAALGGFAALGAILAAPGAPFDVTSGTLLGLKGLMAALVVGFAGFWRAFIAGIALGIVEAAIASGSVGGVALGPSFQDIIPIGGVILFIVWWMPRNRLAVE